MLSLLGLEHELVPVNLLAGEHKSSAFLQLNPLGQVPVLVDGDVVIRDSQAILVYLARRYGSEDWLPLEAEAMAKTAQWLSIAANDIQQSVAAARLHFLFNAQIDLELAQSKAYRILQVIDEHLQKRQWLECVSEAFPQEGPTIADIACFPYIALAADGKIALKDYPHAIAWIDRIKQLPGYIGMPGL
jgi:glutathione S-transferase